MVSPLYAGYKAGDEQQRRYPGGGISGGGSRFVESPQEFINVFQGIENAVDNASYSVMDKATFPVRAPKWLWEEYVADFKKAFAVAGGYRGAGTPDVSDFSAAERAVFVETDDTALFGASDFVLNLNPADYIEDPKGTIWKQVKKAYTASVNWEDLESRGRDYFNRRLIAGTGASAPGELEQAAREAFAQHASRQTSNAATTSSPDILKLTDQEVFKPGGVQMVTAGGTALTSVKEGKVDVYANLGSSILGYYRSADSAFFRRSSHKKTLYNTITALQEDLESKRGSILGLTPSGGMTSADLAVALNSFEKQAEVAEKLSSFTTVLSGKGGVTTAIGKALASGDDSGIASALTKLKSSTGDLETALDDALTHFRSLGPQYSSLTKDFEGTLQEMKTALSSVSGLNYTSPASATVLGQAANIRLTAGNLKNQIDALDRKISGSSELQLGLEEKFLKKAVLNNVLGDFSDPSKLGYVGTVLKESGSSTVPELLGLAKRGEKLAIWNKRVWYDRLRQDGSDIADAVLSGKVMDRYVFGTLVRNRSYWFTPRMVVESFLEKTHYLGTGLSIDHETFETFLTTGLIGPNAKYSWANRNLKRMADRGWLDNNFNLSFSTSAGSSFSLRSVTGGKHFGVALGLFNFYQSEYGAGVDPRQVLDPSYVAALRAHLSAVYTGTNFNAEFERMLKLAAINKILNAKTEAELQAIFQHVPMVAEGGIKTLSDYLAQNQALKKWMEDNGIDFTFDPSRPFDLSQIQNMESMQALLEAIKLLSKNPDTIDITKQFASHMARFTRFLNKVQTNLLGKNPVVKKVVSTYVNFKTIVINRAADLLTQAIIVATGGTGEAFAPVIRRAVGFALKKVEKTISAVQSAIRKGDFSKAGQFIEDAAVFYGKTLAYIFSCMGCIVGVVLLPVFGVILAAIIPVSQLEIDIEGGSSSVCSGETYVSQCPLRSPSITTFSYETGVQDQENRHGSNAYWQNIVKSSTCRYTIPSMGSYPNLNGNATCPGTGDAACSPENDLTSMCTGTSPAQPYYGYALDIATPPGGPKENHLVFMPDILDVSEWTVAASGSYASGAWAVFTGRSTSGQEYIMFFLHLTASPSVGQTFRPGDCITSMLQGGIFEEHLHIELGKWNPVISSWEWMKPETAMSC